MTYQDFITKHRLRLKYNSIMARPDRTSEWDKSAYHYQVKIYQDAPDGLDNLGTLKYERERFELVIFYSKGEGHKEKKYPYRPIPPGLIEVLDSLRLDWSFAHHSFDDFCWELGYDADSRKAYAIYESCVEIGLQVERLFDRAALNELGEIEPL